MTTTHQSHVECSNCGSMYRNGVYCNVCNEDMTNNDIIIETKKNCQSKGRMWNKKLGRYLTQLEIKQGN